jgi:predicted nuclease of predicted toxin-antitoxin system
MRILLDHNTPAPLRYWLIGHEVETAYERGWAELTNGDLLKMAEQVGFDVMITTDKGIRYQQNLAGRRLSLVVIGTNDWTRIRRSKSVVVDAISEVPPGSFLEIEIPFD